MKRISVITLAIVTAACQPAPSGEQVASAAQMPQPAASTDQLANTEGPNRILGFVQGACGDCHAVQTPGLSPNPEAPPFADIANRKGLTYETLSQWLRDAHNYPEVMDFDLDAPQVDDLAAYILTLRDENYKPPIQ